MSLAACHINASGAVASIIFCEHIGIEMIVNINPERQIYEKKTFWEKRGVGQLGSSFGERLPPNTDKSATYKRRKEASE